MKPVYIMGWKRLTKYGFAIASIGGGLMAIFGVGGPLRDALGVLVSVFLVMMALQMQEEERGGLFRALVAIGILSIVQSAPDLIRAFV